MRCLLKTIFTFLLVLPVSAYAADDGFIFEGNVLTPPAVPGDPPGAAITTPVDIKVEILGASSCVLYTKTHLNVDPSDDSGFFMISIDGSSATIPEAASFAGVFGSGTFCSTSHTSTSPRSLRLSFRMAGVGSYEALTEISLKSAPFAINAKSAYNLTPETAQNFNGQKISNLADPTSAQDAATRAWVLANTGATGTAGGDLAGTYPNPVVNKIRGTNVNVTALTTSDILQYNGTDWVNRTVPACAVGEFLTFSGTAWTCSTATGGGGVTTLAANAPLSTNAATGAATLSFNYDNTKFGLNGSNQLVPASNSIGATELAATAVTAGTYGSATQVPTISVDSDGRLIAASSTALSIDASAISAGTLPVSRGGTNATTFNANQVVVSNATGTALTSMSCTSGQTITFDVSGYANCTTPFNFSGSANKIVVTNGTGQLVSSSISNTALRVDSNNNVGLGNGNLMMASGASYHVGIGTNALSSLSSTSMGSVAIGYNSMMNATTAEQNVAVGFQAANNATTAGYNAGVGTNVLFGTTTGSYNSVLGANAFRTSTNGSQNVMIGNSAGEQLPANSSSNIFIGNYAGGTINTATANTFIVNNSSDTINPLLYGKMSGIAGNDQLGVGKNPDPGYALDVEGDAKAVRLIASNGAAFSTTAPGNEILNYYKAATNCPSVNIYGTSPVTYASTACKYSQIGKKVTLSGSIQYTCTSCSGSNLSVQFDGAGIPLPSTDFTNGQLCSISMSYINAANLGHSGRMKVNAGYAMIQVLKNTTSGTANLTSTDISGGIAGELFYSCEYFAQ